MFRGLRNERLVSRLPTSHQTEEREIEGGCSLDPSSSRFAKQLSMILLFSSSNLSALVASRLLMAVVVTGRRSRQAKTRARRGS